MSGSREKVDGIRGLMCSGQWKDEPLQAYIIPTEDAHQSEYIADCDKRRQFISGFTGSAGVAVVTPNKAFLWTDGRYHLQASQQLDLSVWTLMKLGNEGVVKTEEWLSGNIPAGGRIGFDPQLMSHDTYGKYSKALECSGQVLVSVAHNLVDQVWGHSQPERPHNTLISLPLKYSGRSWQDKVQDVRNEMQSKGVVGLVVTALDEVAWLFNLRGSDVQFNPVFFAYAIVTTNDIRLMIDQRQVTSAILEHLKVSESGGVLIEPYASVADQVQSLLSTVSAKGKIWVNSASSYALVSIVPKLHRMVELSPIQLLKGIKNATEIQGMRNAHIRDSAALCEYLAWLELEVPKGRLDEVTAADKLYHLRREQPDFISLSFPTISSSGPSGAIIHYCPSPATARPLTTNELYLCDSGGQYLDGTTDVTRTVSFGTPTLKEKECFTRVLKGHIALCTAVFPNKTMGNQLDCLARSSLWEAGLDYKHGTGHGVGAFLNVHEGPHGIGKKPYSKPIQENMFVTDEPGFYEDGAFGIRIENVELVKTAQTKYNFSNTGYLSMEPVTLVPIQQKMIDPELLTAHEIEWLNSYHSECLDKVGGYLSTAGKDRVFKWLCEQTQLIG